MALPNVSFNTQSGALSPLQIGSDATSALYFHDYDTPNWSSGINHILVYDIKQAEVSGIIQGVADMGIVHYHVSEFFRIAPSGTPLYIILGGGNLNVLKNTLIAAAKGEVRQVGVFCEDITQNINLQLLSEELDAEDIFHTVFIKGGFSESGFNYSENDLGNRVAIVGAGSLTGQGYLIVSTFGKQCMSSLGVVLGATALSRVHECIGYVEKFDVSSNTENDDILLLDNSDVNKANITSIDNIKYLCFIKHNDVKGTYLVNSRTGVDFSDDFSFIERNRTMGKAKRLVRAALVKKLNSPLYVDASGKLSKNTIKLFEGLCQRAMNIMLGAGEVSNFRVLINPLQNVLQDSTLYIQLEIQPVGVARNIVVNIGFALNLTN